MSKNTEQENAGRASFKQGSTAAPIANSEVVTHLKTCQRMAADAAQDAFKTYMEKLDEALEYEKHNAASNQEQVEISEIQSTFRASRAEIERYYCGYLSEGFVKFKKQKLNTAVGNDDEHDMEQLSLVDKEDLEESIAISSITRRADSYFAEPLWALNQRFAVLNGGQQVTEANNPASPVQLCESLRKSLKLLPLNTKTKHIAYKIYDRHLLDLARDVIEEVNNYLKSAGILPDLRYTVPTGKAPASYFADEEGSESQESRAPQEVNLDQAQEEIRRAYRAEQGRAEIPIDQNLSADEYHHELLVAIRNLQDRIFVGEPGPAAEQVAQRAPAASEVELLDALQILQHQTQTLDVQTMLDQQPTPADLMAVVDELKSLINKDSDAEEKDLGVSDMQTIDLVGMLFEYMLNDENLPDQVKTVLSHLHTPFLKIAFIDPGFFEEHDHPARLLLNSLAEAGARWVSNDGSQQYDIFEKIKAVVARVIREFDQDIKFITTLLMEFNSFTKNINRRQELMERRATEKAQGEEKLREVKLRVNDEIRNRTHNRELPSALLLFLLQPWSDYLSFALLRYGDHSEKWTRALALVDDLLWSIKPKSKEEDKARQLELEERIVESIKLGFDTIGFDQTKGKKLIEALSSLMHLAMQSKRAEPAPAPMRHKLEQIAAEKAGSQLPNAEAVTPEEAQMVEKLKVIEFGTWFEFEGGRRLKIAWYNARTSHYMLVDQMGKRVDMMSGLQMAREMIGGTAKIISGSSKPFFERALENIFHKLAEKAEKAEAPATS